MVVRNSPSARRALDEATREAAAAAELQSLPVQHTHACGIDVGDASHWVCVESTPDGSDTVREFPAHTQGLRDLVAWLKLCCVTTIALEATGVYSHVLFLTLLEASFAVVVTSAKFTKQIQGRPKTDKLDCQWIQRLHRHGLLPPIFQPDEATQTLRDFVRQRANLVRLSAQHVQRMQKALELMPQELLGSRVRGRKCASEREIGGYGERCRRLGEGRGAERTGPRRRGGRKRGESAGAKRDRQGSRQWRQPSQRDRPP